MIVWGVLLSLFLCLAGIPTAQAGTDTIRVSLLQQIDSITVASPQGLLIHLPGEGDLEWSSSRPLAITSAGGLSVNARRVRADVAEISARTGEITVNELSVSGRVIVKRQNGRLLVINEVGLEDYVAGVVPHEMSAGWHPEALKAQAVAARTYVLYQRVANASRDYDVVAGVGDQVYRGRHGADQRTRQAVDDTRDVVVTYQDAPIFAAFSSTAAGPTEDAINVWSKDLPYLKGVECPFDASSPYFEWRNAFSLERLETNLRQQGYPVGTVASITPFWYSRAGRVIRIRILHSGGELILRGEDLRRVIGYSVVPSTQFQVETFGSDITVAGRGNGHAVGLCQWGAKELAERGYTFQQILTYYFPGTELRRAAALPLR